MKFYKILIIGEQETAASLKRAFTHADTLKNVLISRYILLPDIENAITLIDIDAAKRFFSSLNISLLFIIHDQEGKTERLISDIRFGAEGNHLARIPIILLSTQSENDIKDLEEALKRGIYLRDGLLSDVQKSFCLSALIGQYHHDLNSKKNNLHIMIGKIQRAVLAKYGENSDFVTIVSGLKQEKNIDYLKDCLVGLKKSIEEIEEQEEKR